MLARLAALWPAGAVLVEEAPSHRPAMHAHLPMEEWGGFLTVASGGLGYSLPGAVGVALARLGEGGPAGFAALLARQRAELERVVRGAGMRAE